MEKETEVLIVGAGPAGLVLALELAYCDIPFRIIDQKKGLGETSRAMLIVPRVLEGYRKFGLDRWVLKEGIPVQEAIFSVDAEQQEFVPLKKMGSGKSAYPHMYTYPQDRHEKRLVSALSERNVEVEWETELVSLKETSDSVAVTLKNPEEMQSETFSYIIGCDGASSTVRKQAGIRFSGETYPQTFFVMDAAVKGVERNSLTFSFAKDQFALFFPLRNRETMRVIGLFPSDMSEETEFDALKPRLEEVHQVTIQEKNWFSPYKVHRRIADRYQTGRIFLAGDAAHIHSPVGGQGMNAGIGDAVNLGWKLEAVLQQKAPQQLLSTYETERRPFANKLASTTDALFKQLASPSERRQRIRDRLMPLAARVLRRSPFLRKQLYTVLSQLYVSYPDSELSEGTLGRIQAGDRLPYAEGERFEFVRQAGWQLHVFEEVGEQIDTLARQYDFSIVKRKWTDKAKKAHFKKEGMYLVRPDGHIGWTGEASKRKLLERYLINRGAVLK